jgi:hypothetical protein
VWVCLIIQLSVRKMLCVLMFVAGSGEKFGPISINPYLSIINRLFNEINQLFLEFLLEIENFIENRLDISLKFFISTGYLITKPRFSPDIGLLWKLLVYIRTCTIRLRHLLDHLREADRIR